jgi:hypothetical protein
MEPEPKAEAAFIQEGCVMAGKPGKQKLRWIVEEDGTRRLQVGEWNEFLEQYLWEDVEETPVANEYD